VQLAKPAEEATVPGAQFEHTVAPKPAEIDPMEQVEQEDEPATPTDDPIEQYKHTGPAVIALY